ncbi:MAG TPA: sulfocyanin-like copper-binding protein, partial [Gemmatimonadales bacterium]|nr:sulfocyanin-like copper-binding protein [Gemmatimonadales bacterium]
MKHRLIAVALLAGLFGACSNETDRPQRTETGTSIPSSSISETTASRVDSPAALAAESVAATPSETPRARRVRPSVDPGRKTTPPSPRSGESLSVPKPTGAAAATSAAPASSPQGKWLSYDAKTNTVTFELIGGPTGFQFNGYSSGGATLVLPSNANVVMPFINKDGTPHSAEIISGDGPLPNAAVDAAIPRAYTNQLLQGLPQEGTDTMRYPVPDKGSYRIFCGVPGHGLSGMWI